MNEKFNINAKVEKFTTMLGMAVRLIVIDPSPIRMRKVDNGRNEAFCVFVSMTMLRCYLVSSPAISNPRSMYRTQV